MNHNFLTFKGVITDIQKCILTINDGYFVPFEPLVTIYVNGFYLHPYEYCIKFLTNLEKISTADKELMLQWCDIFKQTLLSKLPTESIKSINLGSSILTDLFAGHTQKILDVKKFKGNVEKTKFVAKNKWHRETFIPGIKLVFMHHNTNLIWVRVIIGDDICMNQETFIQFLEENSGFFDYYSDVNGLNCFDFYKILKTNTNSENITCLLTLLRFVEVNSLHLIFVSQAKLLAQILNKDNFKHNFTVLYSNYFKFLCCYLVDNMSTFNYYPRNHQAIFNLYLYCYVFCFQTSIINSGGSYELISKANVLVGESSKPKLKNRLNDVNYELRTNKEFEMVGLGTNTGCANNEMEIMYSWDFKPKK